ncbi:LamG domain-containing protein [Verrucomicrobiales bacterium]|nr:LamG domain-containing protein [Verrucomicrobiales bacterium]
MRLFLFIPLFALLVSTAAARTWTSSDGNQLEAEFVDATESSVTIRRESDGRRFTMELSKLSQEDQEWVSAKVSGSGDSAGVELPESIASLVEEAGKLIFEDNFDREDPEGVEALGESWGTNSKSRAQGEKQNDLVDGTLVMQISPKADHAISTRHEVSEPFKDAVVALRIKLDDSGDSLKLAYNDRQHKEVHAGHVNGVTISPTKVLVADERSARFLLKYRDKPEMASEKAEAQKLAEKVFDTEVEVGEWHDIVTHHSGEALTVYIDGEEVASHTSPGFAHETKRDFVFAVPVHAVVDDLKIWKLESAPSE